MLKKKRSFTPTLGYSFEKKFSSTISVLIGGQAGIAAYQLVPILSDTLGPSGDQSTFADYGIFVGHLDLTPGMTFQIGKHQIFTRIGGGVSYYHAFPYASMDVFVTYQNSSVNVFSSYIEEPESGQFSTFAKLLIRMSISKRFDVSFQYSRHFEKILNGEFEFHHTETPAIGSIELIPQGIALAVHCRLKTKS